MSVEKISREELKGKLDRGEEVVLVEALGEAHFEEAHLSGAINIPYDRVDELAPTMLPDKSAQIVALCPSARPSSHARPRPDTGVPRSIVRPGRTCPYPPRRAAGAVDRFSLSPKKPRTAAMGSPSIRPSVSPKTPPATVPQRDATMPVPTRPSASNDSSRPIQRPLGYPHLLAEHRPRGPGRVVFGFWEHDRVEQHPRTDDEGVPRASCPERNEDEGNAQEACPGAPRVGVTLEDFPGEPL